MSTASLFGSIRRQRGLTMIEMVIFIVVVSIAAVGVLVVMNATAQHSGDAQLRKQALAVAEGILEEIEMARFTYCDPADANATTAQFAAINSANPTNPQYCASIVENVGPETGNTRPFDNVNDYVPSGGALGKQFQFNLTDVNNSGIPNLAGTYTAYVTISAATLPNLESDPGVNTAIGSVLQINVVVKYGNNNQYSVMLDGYRTQYAPNLMPVQSQ